MMKLTDSQLILLSRASQRDDGILDGPGAMQASAATRVAAILVERKLMRELRSKPRMPVWRRDDGHAISLVITQAGRSAIVVDESAELTKAKNVEASSPASTPVSARRVDSKPDLAGRSKVSASAHAKAIKDRSAEARELADPKSASDKCTKVAGIPPALAPQQPARLMRPGTKQKQIVDLLHLEGGASIDELVAATNWLPHTARAALTGLRQRGFVIEGVREKGQTTIYRIVRENYPQRGNDVIAA